MGQCFNIFTYGFYGFPRQGTVHEKPELTRMGKMGVQEFSLCSLFEKLFDRAPGKPPEILGHHLADTIIRQELNKSEAVQTNKIAYAFRPGDFEIIDHLIE